ncbi:peroxiredoxin [Microaceticoccus formicicus]|uniref:peroxiredoxin n=1 Tax=Microaceticoccus formicicus TaxID=3118105 RepID=UPI003CD04765|nr:peroxiredoxin [Peptoniphilaceae bacterium AMB_02]
MTENINQEVNFPLIGSRAPEFEAVTTQGDMKFPQDYEGKWVILFSHPADFTPVCTTEFMTFASMHDEFRELNTELVGLSIDSIHSHLAWLNAIRGYTWNGIEKPAIDFPVIADLKMDVAKKYGMLQGESDTSAVRAVFFIDPKGVIRTILYYPAALGRNFDEIKRIILGLQKADAESVALPANWEPGKDVIVPPPGTCGAIKERMELAKGEGYEMKDWFLTFKEDK